MGLRPAGFWALVSTAAELGGGVLLAVGLLTPLATAALIAQSVVIVGLVHLSRRLRRGASGLKARVETEALGFTFDTFESAWDVLTGVTTANLTLERRDEAKAAVRAAMWPAEARGPRYFRNVTQFIVAERAN